MEGLYERLVGTSYPGCFVIMIDQSGSMVEPYGNTTKQVVAAEAINKVIFEIRSASVEGKIVKDRCFVIVIGYGAEIKALLHHKTSELEKAILRVEERPETLLNGKKIVKKLPIYIDPKAENGTPMDAAFDKAYNLVATFCKTYQESFPPIVINITDGKPNDLQDGSGEKTLKAAYRLMTLGTSQGSLLLYNAHIGNSNLSPVLLPNDKSQLKETYAQYLFDLTSPIPKPLIPLAESAGFNPQPGARGMVFNADAEALIKLVVFGSKPMYD